MRSILLIILLCGATSIAHSQSCDSTKLRDISHGLTTGLACCADLEFADSVIVMKDKVIANLSDMVRLRQDQTDIYKTNWQLADSSYRNMVSRYNTTNADLQRVKRGKRTWIITTATATVTAIIIGLINN